MADNNYDDRTDWKQRLADLQDTDDASFDRELAWNRLHERLQDKKRKKKFIWYWLAAASVLAILIISFLMTNRNEQMVAQQNPPKSVDKKPPTKTVFRTSKNNIERPNSIAIVNTVSPAGIKSQHKLSHNNKTLASPSIKITHNDFAKEEIMNIAAIPVDTAISVVANVPVKKKLRVVHVNELGDPVNETFRYKKYSDRTSAHFRFMNQQVFTLPSADAKTDHKIFTIKTN